MEVNIHFQITPHMLSEKEPEKLEGKAEAIFDALFVAQSQVESMSTKMWNQGRQVQIR